MTGAPGGDEDELGGAGDREKFARDGFLGPITIMSPEEMALIRDYLRNDIDDLAHDETIASQVASLSHEGLPLKALYDRHQSDAIVSNLATHPEIVNRAKDVLSSDSLRLWRSTFWIKQPFARRLEWHQDTYKDEGLGSFPNINAWIAIDEATEENGVRLVAGTHRSILDRACFKTEEYVRSLQESFDLPSPPATVKDPQITTMALQPGQCFIFDGRVLHGSPSNDSPHRRAGFVTRFIPSDVELPGGPHEYTVL